MTTPLKTVSVIIPMYNVEDYIEKCIDSIERQTYSNIEIVLVDDGSTDNTYEIAKKISEKYENITITHQNNGGQAKARNLGLSLSHGYYISFIDSDDFIEENMIETLVTMCEVNQLDIAECCYDDVFEDGKRIGNKYYVDIDEAKVYEGKDFYNCRVSLSPCDKIYKMEYLKRIGFKCTEGYYAEDIYDTTYAIIHAKRVMHVNEVFYHYRRDNAGSTRNNSNIERRIKLGKDKLYIASRMEQLRNKEKLNGYINEIISRNVIGTFACPLFVKNRKYRKEIIETLKEYQWRKILWNNMNISIFGKMIAIGIKKITSNAD